MTNDEYIVLREKEFKTALHKLVADHQLKRGTVAATHFLIEAMKSEIAESERGLDHYYSNAD